MYKVRSYVQHTATQDIFRVTNRRGSINTHYRLKIIHSNNGYSIGDYTNWISEENLNAFYTKLDAKTVKVLYTCQ